MKTCGICKVEKPLDEFGNNKSNKDGKARKCKECRKEYRAKNKSRIQEREREYAKENREQINKKNRERLRKSPEAREKKAQYQREYREKNKRSWLDKANEYQKNRKKKDPLYKLKKNLRDRIYSSFKSNSWYKTNYTAILLGCTYEEAFKHIESQFTEGMNWDNHGLHGWHIDHIVPLASANTELEMEELCHYSNLQPLWAKDNWSKGDKIQC